VQCFDASTGGETGWRDRRTFFAWDNFSTAIRSDGTSEKARAGAVALDHRGV